MSAPLCAEVDLSGEWAGKYHEDWPERHPGPDIADYTGLPINRAARMKADSWEASVQTIPERQCIPHSFPYSFRGPAKIKIWAELDPVSERVRSRGRCTVFSAAPRTRSGWTGAASLQSMRRTF